MKVQDQNILLQQMLSLKLNVGVAESSDKQTGFAEMLKSPVAEKSSFAQKEKDFSAAKETKTIDITSKKDVLVEDNAGRDAKKTVSKTDKEEKTSKENIKEEPVAESETKAKSEPKEKTKQKENKGEMESNDSAVVIPQTKSEDAAPVAEEKTEDLELETPVLVAAELLPGEEVVLFSGAQDETIVADFQQEIAAPQVVEISEEAVLPAQNVVPETENVLVKEKKTNSAAPIINKATQNEMAAVAEGEQITSQEEVLLMEQAAFLDKKLGSTEKISINVSVEEEKIADPIVKDVLQNRFEVDSMFQSVEAAPEEISEVIEPNEQNFAKAAKVMNAVASEILPEVSVVTDVNEKVVATERTNVVSEVANVTASGKEVVFETANAARNEVFAKINETSSRDSFRGMAKEAVEQIKVNITKSAIKGVDTVEIQLKPEDLGKIQIKMHIARDGKLQAEIVSSRAETSDMLQKEASSLAKAFNDAGYDTDSRSFNFSFRGESQAEQQKRDSELLRFIGDTFEQEAENSNSNDNYGYDPLLGLNIRV